MKAFSKKSSYLLIIMMIAGTAPDGNSAVFCCKEQENLYDSGRHCVSAGENDDPGRHSGGKGNQCYYDRRGNRRILYEKNAEEPRDPASITKIITCLLTLENMDLNDEVTITHDPVTTGQNIALKKGRNIKGKRSALCAHATLF